MSKHTHTRALPLLATGEEFLKNPEDFPPQITSSVSLSRSFTLSSSFTSGEETLTCASSNTTVLAVEVGVLHIFDVEFFSCCQGVAMVFCLVSRVSLHNRLLWSSLLLGVAMQCVML